MQRKPSWIRAKAANGSSTVKIRELLREHKLSTVCEEASCPNLGECFSNGTATFMIMGDICTRRCPFCDVGHGKPLPLNQEEPQLLAQAIKKMKLHHAVITSVDRDDLRDGGAGHFVNCITEIRENSPEVSIEILVPDFRGRQEKALDILVKSPPNIFNHNIETVPSLYKQVRPGASYKESLLLIQNFYKQVNNLGLKVPTKSGFMLGVGEKITEVKELIYDLREHNCQILTIGQYLQPSKEHLPVVEYIHPDIFAELADFANELEFTHVASSPMVRSSYHAKNWT